MARASGADPMESSKCPKCGDEPHFIAHVDKWYCFGCNSYVGEAEDVAAEEHVKAEEVPVEPARDEAKVAAPDGPKPTECRNCGAELQDLKGGRLYCFMCESYQDEIKETPHVENEAQVLVDKASVPEMPAVPATPQIPTPATPPQVPEVKPPEPASTPISAPAPIQVPVAEPQPVQASTPQPPAPPEQHAVIAAKPAFVRMCTSCGQPLKYIDKYQRYYCYGCKKYAPKDEKLRGTPDAKKCPECGGELRFVEKYNEHYCSACKKYPLRDASKAEVAKPEVLSCLKCGAPLKWVEKYSRHYCYTCKEYAPKGFGGASAQGKSGDGKICPGCNGAMKYIAEYDEWYCYKCRKYSLRPSKPAMFM